MLNNPDLQAIVSSCENTVSLLNAAPSGVYPEGIPCTDEMLDFFKSRLLNPHEPIQVEMGVVRPRDVDDVEWRDFQREVAATGCTVRPMRPPPPECQGVVVGYSVGFPA